MPAQDATRAALRDLGRATVVVPVQFGEGPVVLADGRVVYLEMASSSVNVYDGRRATRLLSVPGVPNGLALGPDGALYVANNGGLFSWSYEEWTCDGTRDGSIQRVTEEGAVSDYAADLPGAAPHRPNDLCFGPGGRLYFTDPGNWETLLMGGAGDGEADGYRGGALFVRQADGQVERLADVPAFPNGIAVTPDQGALVVAQTMRFQVLCFPLRQDGTVSEPEVYVTLPEPYGPDGLCFADDGTLFVAATMGDGVVVVDPDRTVRGVLRTGAGSLATNVALAPQRLWVTTGPGRYLGYFDVRQTPLPLLR